MKRGNMKQLKSALLILTFVLGACSTNIPTTEIESTQPVAVNESATESTVPAREAVLSQIEKTVSARASSESDFSPATINMKLLPTGGVETGDDGRARVDLLPEGTIVRVGPNSSFMIPILIEENGEPQTVIELFFGKIYIILNGGSLDVKTPSGVASVRGSLLSVEYDMQTERISAACLEGHCSIENEDGEEIEIPEGMESFIEAGELPMEPFPMDQDEVQAWLDENPDLDEFMEELPDPKDFPDLPDDFDGNLEDIPQEFFPEGFFDGENLARDGKRPGDEEEPTPEP